MIASITPIPAFTDNYIWLLRDSNSRNACVVDPGDAEPVISYLKTNKLTLDSILITHHHPDHTGGVKKLVELFDPGVYGPGVSGIQGINNVVAEGDQFDLFDVRFCVLEIPGHTLDHIAFYSIANAAPESETPEPVLFCGDTLFAAGCGRVFEGTPEQMQQSLSKLSELDEKTRVYCGHEYTLANLQFAKAAEADNKKIIERIEIEQNKRNHDQATLPSTIKLELETNPFLRCDKPSLKASAGNYKGHPVNSAVETFAGLRSWKDNFRAS